MSQKNSVTVKICGNEYHVSADESIEYIRRVTDLVDEKMTSIHMADSRLSTVYLSVLTAINCADMYLKLREENEALYAELEKLTAAAEEGSGEKKQQR